MNEFEENLLAELHYYRESIRPLREAADGGDGGYEKYDEAYNEWLEGLHTQITAHFVGKGLLKETA